MYFTIFCCAYTCRPMRDYIDLVESYVVKCKKTIENIQRLESEIYNEDLKEILEKIEKADLLFATSYNI